MQEFRTEIKTQPSAFRMSIKSSILTQGSCFADAIGNRLILNKLKAWANPFGVIYNPESIHKVLTYSIFNEPLPEHTYLNQHDVYLNYNCHSEFSALNKPALVSRLMNTIGSTHYFLKDTEWLLITYGTAWVYQRKDTGEIVANCHKVPADAFTRSLLSTEEIMSSFTAFYHFLKQFNPRAKIILTVSPVRHLKDTLELNSVSKSVLRLACHSIARQFDSVEYFPAYEMMIDDLRDYRFYKPDMLHPTREAEDYIWEKFMERYLDENVKDFIKKWKVILSALHHRPFHPNSSLHQQFLRDTLKKLEELKLLVNVEEEESLIKKQIIS
jgi:hypothetical protein